MTEPTTQLSIIVTHKNQLIPLGHKLHKYVTSYFSTERFASYAALHHINNNLKQLISQDLTAYLRTDSIKDDLQYHSGITAICSNAVGHIHENTQDNVVIFTIEVFYDGK